MKQWADQLLPKKCVEVGWETLEEQFRKLIEDARNSKDHDDIFDNLKSAVVNEAMSRHEWEDKVCKILFMHSFHFRHNIIKFYERIFKYLWK